MSVELFPFALSRLPKATEHPVFKTRIVGLNESSNQRAAEFGDEWVLRVVGTVRFPQPALSKTLADWWAFVEARLGRYDSFLYLPFAQRYRTVTLEAVGTGNASQTAFALDSKYIKAATLQVYVDAVLKTVTTDYVLSGNNTAPIITFTSPPGGGLAITATYDRYFPMFLESDGYEPRYLTADTSDATRKAVIDGIELVGIAAGAHLV